MCKQTIIIPELQMQAILYHLRDNCIVIEALRMSIGSFTVANLGYLATRSGDSKRVFATVKLPMDVRKASNTIQLSLF